MTNTLDVSTNNLINVIKLMVAIVIILMAAKAYHHLNFYYLELPFFLVIIALVLWFYRISFHGYSKCKQYEIIVVVSVNVFGYANTTLTLNSVRKTKKMWLKNRKCEFDDVGNFKKLTLQVVGSQPAKFELTLYPK